MDLISSSQQMQCVQALKNSLPDVIAFAFYWPWNTVMPTRWFHHSLGTWLRLNSPIGARELGHFPVLHTFTIFPSSMEKASCLRALSICDLQSAFHLIVHSLHMQEPMKIRSQIRQKTKSPSNYIVRRSDYLNELRDDQTCTATLKSWITNKIIYKLNSKIHKPSMSLKTLLKS